MKDGNLNGSATPETKVVEKDALWEKVKALNASGKLRSQNTALANVTKEVLQSDSTPARTFGESGITAEKSGLLQDKVAVDGIGSVTASANPSKGGVSEPLESLQANTTVAAYPVANTDNDSIKPLIGKGCLEHLLTKLTKGLVFVRTISNTVYIVVSIPGLNSYAIALDSRQGEVLIAEAVAKNTSQFPRKSNIAEIIHYIQGWAEKECPPSEVWNRVGRDPNGGIVIDSGNKEHTHFRVSASGVEILVSGSGVLFYRTSTMLPMAMPAEVGNIDLLKKHFPVHPVIFILILAFLSYTLANPKIPTSKFLVLWLQGGEGTAKSSIAKILIDLIDPNTLGVQKLHTKQKDFAIAAQSAHVLAYDNLREISNSQSDLMCVAVTGGSISSRTLYSDSGQTAINLMVALILTSIHPIVTQPDLAQRTLHLKLSPLPEDKRRSDKDLAAEFAQDKPAIIRGLLDLIAKVFAQLPHAIVTQPTRMIEFSKWLAGMELVNGVPVGTFQGVYCETLNEGQLDAIQSCVLATAVLEFAESNMQEQWSGTPAQLLDVLNDQATYGTQRSMEWPRNPIALSKRLLPLQTSLLTQGISLELSRGKTRIITIKKVTGGSTTK